MSVGTTINAVARVESAEAIVVDLKVQRSNVTPKPPADPANPDAFTPQGTATLSIETTVRSKPGEPMLVTGRQLQSGKEGTQTWVVLTSQIASAAPAEKKTGAAGEAEERFKVFQLVNGSAPAMANVLSSVLQREGVRIAVDERTNTLVMRGEPLQLDIAQALIQRLDVQIK
jgi:type II secretory pathway component GspD/PulD (secretin)